MTMESPNQLKEFSYLPVWRARWVQDTFLRRAAAALAEMHMNAFGTKKTVTITPFAEKRIISVAEHDAMIEESDRLWIRNQEMDKWLKKRRERSKTLVGKILNELS